MVHVANIQDRDGARLLLDRLEDETKARVQQLWADGAYGGRRVEWVREKLDALLEVVSRPPQQKGFHVLTRRWVVERTLGWSIRYRRLSPNPPKGGRRVSDLKPQEGAPVHLG